MYNWFVNFYTQFLVGTNSRFSSLDGNVTLGVSLQLSNSYGSKMGKAVQITSNPLTT